MKTLNLARLAAFTAAALIWAPLAYAEREKTGNGGGAHVCYTDETKKIEKSIESYDLWEGRKFIPVEIPEWNGVEAKADLLARALRKVAKTQPGLARDIGRVLPILAPPTLVDASDIELALIPDAKLLALGKNCAYKQMVNWMDPEEYVFGSKDKILRDETYYAKGGLHMDPLSQAALDLHEAAYKVYRAYEPGRFARYGSREIRKFVAEAFSSGPISTVLVDPMKINVGFSPFEGETQDYGHLYSFDVLLDVDLRESCGNAAARTTLTYRSGASSSANWKAYGEGFFERKGSVKIKRGESSVRELGKGDQILLDAKSPLAFDFEAATDSRCGAGSISAKLGPFARGWISYGGVRWTLIRSPD